MTIIEALTLCRDHGWMVRPVCWRNINPNHWVEYRNWIFVEHGTLEEIPHALRLTHAGEFLGPWEEAE